MALLGIRWRGNNYSFDEFRDYLKNPTNDCTLPPEVVEMAIAHEGSEPNKVVHSPSRILGCNRQAVLTETADYFLDLEHAYASLRGTLIHSGIEHSGIHTQQTLKEERLTVTIDTAYGPQEFSAKSDCIVVLSTEKKRGKKQVVHVKVRDYKTTGEIKHDFLAADKKHQMQVNMYGYVVWKSAEKLFGPNTEVVVDELEVNYLGSNKARRFTSAGPLTDVGYKRKGCDAEVLTLEQITLLPMERVEKFIRARIEKRVREREAGLPPILPPGEDKWCFRCPVYGACRANMTEEAA